MTQEMAFKEWVKISQQIDTLVSQTQDQGAFLIDPGRSSQTTTPRAIPIAPWTPFLLHRHLP
jgi:hypothetical protein